MQRVFVLDADGRPLTPCRPARARLLLTQGKAAVFRRFPFVIRLKALHPEAATPPLRLKIDPGSRTTGLAIVDDASGEVMWAGELTHRGEQVHRQLLQRAGVRRGRRQRHTRYRPARWQNRRRPAGWLPPSLRSRIGNVLTWARRLLRWCPCLAIAYETVRFDTQALINPEISGADYQHGTLFGLELKEYLLLEIEHLTPRSRGGTDRVSNLVIACSTCNQDKGNRTAEEYGFPHLQAQAQTPLKDAAAVNSSRRALHTLLATLGLPIEASSGGRTKWNRKQQGIPKTHWLDAACVGASTPAQLRWRGTIPLRIQAERRQSRQMCLVDERGFPRSAPKKASRVAGFRTGDLVRAVVPAPLVTRGVHMGRVLVRASRSFDIQMVRGRIAGVHAKYCRPLHRQDGYNYANGKGAVLPSQA